uniref:Astacin domain-containing protein n=1 Tax=Strongyloides papillosus TaxID=174720 RepID=A0A0N5BEZ9_STREA
MVFINILFFTTLYVLITLNNCSNKWPNGTIPYIFDQKLRTNYLQKYSLFNTLIDLNKRTCLRFVPKKEKDTNFVEFRYYTRNPSCWNFLTYSNGSNIVAGGPACLSPKNLFHKHNFTDCDIQYINLLYKCPKFIPQLLNCNSSYTILTDKKVKNLYKFNEKKQKWFGNNESFKKYDVNKKDNFLNVTTKDIKELLRLYKKTNNTSLNSIFTKKVQLPTIKSSTIPIPKATSFIETTTSTMTTTKQTKVINDTCDINCNFNIYLKRLFVLHNGNFNVRDTMLESDTLSLKQLQTDNYILQSKEKIFFLNKFSIFLDGDAFISKMENNDSCSCTVPLYRLFNSIISDHFYTTNETELRSARAINGYKFEKIEGYCSQNAGCGALLPLYRFYNPLINDHLYTTDGKEMLFYKNNLIYGYIFERIECYLWNRQNIIKYCNK